VNGLPRMTSFFRTLFLGSHAPLVFLAFFLPILCILGARMVPFGAFIPIVLWVIIKQHRSFLPFQRFIASPFLILGLAMVAWGWASLGWSIAPDDSSSTMTRVGSMLIFGLLALRVVTLTPPDEEGHRRICRALTIGMGAALFFTLTALLFHGGMPALLNHLLSTGDDFRLILLKQGNLLLAILIWPLVIALLLQGKEKLAHAAVAAAIGVLAFMPSSTALVAVLTGTVTYGFCRILQGKKAVAFITACIIAAMLVIFIAIPKVNVRELRAAAPMTAVSLLHRIHIWQFCITKLDEKPLQGWGIKASDSIPGAHDRTALSHRLVQLPLHPHNNVLQAWLELGLIGLALCLAMIALMIKRIHELAQPAAIKAATYATLIAALTGGFAGYGLWQSWWVNGLILIAMLVIALVGGNQRKSA